MPTKRHAEVFRPPDVTAVLREATYSSLVPIRRSFYAMSPPSAFILIAPRAVNAKKPAAAHLASCPSSPPPSTAPRRQGEPLALSSTFGYLDDVVLRHQDPCRDVHSESVDINAFDSDIPMTNANGTAPDTDTATESVDESSTAMVDTTQVEPTLSTAAVPPSRAEQLEAFITSFLSSRPDFSVPTLLTELENDRMSVEDLADEHGVADLASIFSVPGVSVVVVLCSMSFRPLDSISDDTVCREVLFFSVGSTDEAALA
ncbi:hypothetical protein SCP_0801930 [Sparassis crispa]|uniref:Uncharacterized protein n=1 Tax=Sparassis crispa TaxID=139825 RepID=A0A401GTW9_9APHY|nr:hypothetical protein SCP_0801930 [Sparassis crispa]GBE85672.1 hypothetical protein SCP_0801930 [Sparassis crispa]